MIGQALDHPSGPGEGRWVLPLLRSHSPIKEKVLLPGKESRPPMSTTIDQGTYYADASES